MWLSPLKGAHLTLGQLDKTLPVDLERTDPAVENPNEKIERGSIVYIKAYNGTAAVEPQFAIYKKIGDDDPAEKPNAVPYICLQSVLDFQAGMAGNVGQAPETQGIAKETKASGNNLAFIGETQVEGAQTVIGPRVTAISLVQPAEWQTDAFKIDATEYFVGEPLTVEDGLLTHWTTGKNIVGYVTAKPFKRWINDLGASVNGARISGGMKKVINFSTAWIPAAATSGDSGNVKPLATGKPDVTAQAVNGQKQAAAGAAAPAAGAAAPAAGANKGGAPVGQSK